MTSPSQYGFSKTLTISYDTAVSKVTDALKNEGFGILTEIDIRETLKKKLNIDFRKYKILGACNPQLAYKALSQETELGVFLPCNVIVYENDEGQTVVTAVNPMVTLSRIENPALEPIASEVSSRLQNVIASL